MRWCSGFVRGGLVVWHGMMVSCGDLMVWWWWCGMMVCSGGGVARWWSGGVTWYDGVVV